MDMKSLPVDVAIHCGYAYTNKLDRHDPRVHEKVAHELTRNESRAGLRRFNRNVYDEAKKIMDDLGDTLCDCTYLSIQRYHQGDERSYAGLFVECDRHAVFTGIKWDEVMSIRSAFKRIALNKPSETYSEIYPYKDLIGITHDRNARRVMGMDVGSSFVLQTKGGKSAKFDYMQITDLDSMISSIRGKINALSAKEGRAIPSSGLSDELEKLAALRSQGVISDAEFTAFKKKLLDSR